MEALVLKRSAGNQSLNLDPDFRRLPSRVMPGLRGTPAGMTTISAPLRAWARPEGVASWPMTLHASASGSSATAATAAYLALGVDVADIGSDTCDGIRILCDIVRSLD